jgi:tetratricopeptide (TPR) repeat protein
LHLPTRATARVRPYLLRRYDESLRKVESLGEDYQTHTAGIKNGLGVLFTRQGLWTAAEENLNDSLDIRERFRVDPSIPEVLVGLGQLHEAKQEWDVALGYYARSLKMRRTERQNRECEALVGACRANYHLSRFADILPSANEAEQLGQRLEYNDHLASLRLTQGHIAWEGHIPEWGSGFDATLHYYQQALIYALRYNRFLLDEVLWGGGIATPLRPIIPHCLEQGEEGRRMLVALRDWWQTGINGVGKPRPDTISPIEEGIPLLEAERIAREREPGDGSPQMTVVEKIEQALAEMGSG